MSDIIQLLPDSVANQIAAGEVIQRPASVVKELAENAIDAKANSIIINIKDAGRTLIQVIDNGIGMSDTDARLSFERHSTSKIKNADDLFAISTMLSWSYYGLQAWKFLFGKGKITDIIYKLIFLAFVIIGASIGLGSVIAFSDAMIFAMVFPNIIGLVLLSPKVRDELKIYLDKIKSFKASAK